MPFELKDLPSRPSAETRAALQRRASLDDRIEAVDETDAELVRAALDRVAAATSKPERGPARENVRNRG